MTVRTSVRNDGADAVAQRGALEAWLSLGVSCRTPTSVVTLKEARRKSAVYRLAGAGPGGEDVVAKGCSTTTARVEFAVYRNILVQLPVSRLGCYGLAESDEADRSWLFIEDARGEKFDAGKDEHRRLAARWFADVHRTSAEIDLRELPSRGVSHYYGVLENTLVALEAAASNRHLDSSDAAVARRAIRACESISRHWNDVAGICQLLPNTLVHGGIGRKNVQVRHNKGCLEFLPFDWEAAGRGMAAMDLSRVDSVVYAKALGKNARRVQDITAVGRALWSISSIPGEAANLASPWASRTMPKVQAYADELEAVMKRFGWVGS